MPRPSPLAFARFVRDKGRPHYPLSWQLVDLCLYVLQGQSLEHAVEVFGPIWSGLNPELVLAQTSSLLQELKRLSRSVRQPWIDDINLKGPSSPIRFRRPSQRSEEDFQYAIKTLRALRKTLTPPHSRPPYRAE